MQISPTNQLNPFPAMMSPSVFLPFLTKTAAKNGVTVAALLLFRSLNRQRLRISPETRSRWLIICCKKQQKQQNSRP
jgi:hypothetical protein